MAIVPFFAILLVAIVGAVLGVVIALICRRERPPQTETPAPAPPREETRAERATILKKLADKEITREEAETQLGTLGSPVPPVMRPPPGGASTGGKGCLIAAVLVAVGLPFLLLLMGVLWHYVGIAPRRARAEAVRLEAQQKIHERVMQEPIRNEFVPATPNTEE